MVLFFDDFERSKLDRIELMGVINEYSENRGIKVIIIADEEKIASNKADKNNSDTNHQIDNTNNTNLSTTDSNFNYSDFKEKLISRTLKIEPDYKTVIDTILSSYQEIVIGYKDFLIDNKDIIYQIYIESDSNNFRSVKAFIIDYERLHEAWQNSNVSSVFIMAIGCFKISFITVYVFFNIKKILPTNIKSLVNTFGNLKSFT